MRLFGKPGGTRAQFRAALLTIPFDLASRANLPDIIWVSGARGTVWKAGSRPTIWALPGRGTTWLLPPR